MKTLTPIIRVALGVVLCAFIAVLVVALSQGQPWLSGAPAVFAACVVLLSWRFGPSVGLFGSLLGALVFAYFLYPPLGSISVESPGARSALAWMMLAGITISYLLLPPAWAKRNKQPPGLDSSLNNKRSD